MYPTGAYSPKFFGLSKIHKRTHPQAHSFKQGLFYIWSGYGNSRHPSALIKQVTAPHTEYTGLYRTN